MYFSDREIKALELKWLKNKKSLDIALEFEVSVDTANQIYGKAIRKLTILIPRLIERLNNQAKLIEENRLLKDRLNIQNGTLSYTSDDTKYLRKNGVSKIVVNKTINDLEKAKSSLNNSITILKKL